MDNEDQALSRQLLAHVVFEEQRTQSLKEHLKNVTELSELLCPIPEWRSILRIIGMGHDAGKSEEKIQENFRNILAHGNQVHQHGMDHSTAGGQIMREWIPNRTVSDLVSMVIYFHHGLADCVNLETGEGLREHRAQKQIDYEQIKERFFQICDREELKKDCEAAQRDFFILEKQMAEFMEKYKKTGCGNRYFFIGLYLRMMLSVLIDADWTDTSCFFQKIPLPKRKSGMQIKQVWQTCTDHFEEYLKQTIQKNPENGTALSACRQSISDLCRQVADSDQNFYRLTVPTGAGKTLSSLRFALHRACNTEKQHIIYIAPFNSILIQNAEEIRKAVGDPGLVLEHHCNVVCEPDEEEKFRRLIERWDSPIIVTTAVQILNTLFSDKKSCIRRMHVLCNSIIIFDEVQALPFKCMELFHQAVNFLGEFCNTTVVLCSATQPTLAPLSRNNICPCTEMAGEWNVYTETFDRVYIVDKTRMCPNGMEIPDLCEFAMKQADVYESVLVILNTTKSARDLFQALKEQGTEEYTCFHLSNNMCPQHKLDTLTRIRAALAENRKRETGKKIICVSTQVVEAGVNFSFGAVIRSKAGLDSIIQAAGRCNRHKEFMKLGMVYIVEMSKSAENLEHLAQIRVAQAALQRLLDEFNQNSEIFKNRLDSQESIKRYYRIYFEQMKGCSEGAFYLKGTSKTLVDLLGKNSSGREAYRRHYKKEMHSKFAQAFKTVGQAFQVIENNYKISIVVPYNEEAKNWIAQLSSAEANWMGWKEKSGILKKLQRYTVGISESRKKTLEGVLYMVCDNEIMVLSDGYYDSDIGVSDSPRLSFCSY